MKELVDQLKRNRTLSPEELRLLLTDASPEEREYLHRAAREVARVHFGNGVFVRGLIEISNYCRNDCRYCGIRRSNRLAERYRLTPETVLACCEEGYRLGFRTFVLQSGEDPALNDELLTGLIREMRRRWPDCAITLSIGEKSKESYQAYFDAGADRYLLRHETYNHEHYRQLHPSNLSPVHRQQCLRNLKDIGYQVGCGFMVGSPYQTAEYLAEDMLFMKELNPHMIGIGPFIPHHDTPFAGEAAGTLELTLYMLGLIRLMIPKVLLPATTALGTIHPKGRELGILAGANVVMPNLSPTEVRKDYLLYDNKICTGDESAQCRHCLEMRMKSVGYQVVTDRGDSLNI